MSLSDDIGKFCTDLICGDFEENPGNAAMVVGGLISLIPIADQVLDVRDVSGMVYRIGRKGATNATKDDWVDLSLASFGVIPEVGSLFKTIIKPLWKNRKAMKGALRGDAFIGRMLGEHKGKAITFIKTFNWAGNTQMAINSAMQAVDGCDLLLAELSESHWWMPDDLEVLARDMRPLLKPVKGSLKSGIQQGSDALREFVTELIGEDGYAVAQLAMVAATTASSGKGKAGHPTASHAVAPSSHGKPKPKTATAAPQPAKPTGKPSIQSTSPKPKAAATPQGRPPKAKPADQQKSDHKKQGNTERQSAKAGAGDHHGQSRPTLQELLDTAEEKLVHLIGEHMADYAHAKRVGQSWDAYHGQFKVMPPGMYPRIITDNQRPKELYPDETLSPNGKKRPNGIDTLWQIDEAGEKFDIIEAKAQRSLTVPDGTEKDEKKTASAPSTNKKGKRPQRNKKGKPPAESSTEADTKKEESKGGFASTPPAVLKEPRLRILWKLLGEPAKGTQMSKKWVENSIKDLKESVPASALIKAHWRHRILYFFPGTQPKPAAGFPEVLGTGADDYAAFWVHYGARAKGLLNAGDNPEMAIHDQHKLHPSVNDAIFVFKEHEIDKVAALREKIKAKK